MTSLPELLSTTSPASQPLVPVLSIRIGAADDVQIDSIQHTRKNANSVGVTLRRLDDPEICQEFTYAELLQLHFDGRLAIRPNYHRAEKAALRLDLPAGSLVELSENEQAKYHERRDLCLAFLKAEAAGEVSRSNKSMKTWSSKWIAKRLNEARGRAGDDVKIKKPPDPSTLRRWIRRFEDCNYDPMALLKKTGRCGNRESRMPEEHLSIVQEWANKFASNLKPKMSQLYRDMKADFKLRLPGISVPSRTTFERAIAKLDVFHVLAAREGEDAARRALYPVREHLLVTRPFQRVEMDEHKIPIHTWLKKQKLWDKLPAKLQYGITHRRYWISKVIDAYSRVVLGFVITEAPSTESALATARLMFRDKTELAKLAGCASSWGLFGRPEEVVTDSGSQFISDGFRSAMLDLGIPVTIGPARLPQMRGRIERSFRRDSDELYSRIAGYVFENVLRKGDYDAEGNITLDILGLVLLIVRYYVDQYHHSPHQGLAGDTPWNVFWKGVEEYGVLPPPSLDEQRHALSTAIKIPIGNRGVRVAGLYYQSREVQNARRKLGARPTLVRVDTDDLGHVSVRTPDGWLTVPCVTEGFDGVSLEHWQATQAELRRKNASIAALSEDIVSAAVRDIRAKLERAVTEAGIPAPVMTAEDFLQVSRDLARGFDIVRPEHGPATLVEDTTPVVRSGGDAPVQLVELPDDDEYFSE